MTVELRSRQAAAAIHAAVAQVEPRALPARRRLFGGRTLVAIVLAISTPPAGVAFVNAARHSGTPPAESIVADTQTPKDNDERAAGEVQEPGPASLADVDAANDDTKAGTTVGGEQTSEEIRRSSGVEAPATAGCVPLIEDPKGDIDDPAIDILEASITYDAPANKLVIHEVFDDIPESYLPREALAYFFYFNLDGVTYNVLAYVGPASYGEWHFDVQRDDRTVDQWPEGRRSLMYPTGRVDHEADTVTIEVDIDEFNRSERRVAADEGLPPAAGELTRGSTLTNVNMTAYPRTAGPGTQDYAYGCNYVVEGPS